MDVWANRVQTLNVCQPSLVVKKLAQSDAEHFNFLTNLSQSSFHLTVDGKVQSPNLSLFVL